MDIKSSLSIFGLNEKEQEVYLLLAKHGWITALELSRHSPIKRTTLYRILESLTTKGLVEVQIGDKTTHYNAADPKQFESLVIEQEKKTKDLRNTLQNLQESLKVISSVKPNETSVRFYRGTRGLKQMEWKRCEKQDVAIFIFDAGSLWLKYLGRDFAETIREEIVKKNIHIFEIANKERSEPIPENGHPSWSDNTVYVLNHFRGRVVPAKQFEITQDIYILSDAIHIHGYRENDIMGIEIMSVDFAKLMQQIFKFLWNQAEIFDKFGGENFPEKKKASPTPWKMSLPYMLPKLKFPQPKPLLLSTAQSILSTPSNVKNLKAPKLQK